MKSTTFEVINELTLAEAAAWLTRLQDDARTPATEAAFKEWLAANSMHARAFTRVNDVWEQLPGAAAIVQRSQAVRQRARDRARSRRRTWLLASACALVVLATVAAFRVRVPTEHVYQTAVGAQETIVLKDHTRVTLNTDTRLVVAYRKHERHILLERGEALFQVVTNLKRPFIVQAGDVQTVDLGTAFDVHRDSDSVAVALLEGQVRVDTQPAQLDQQAPPIVLAPGERLTIFTDGSHVVDRPDMDEALAWRRGQVYFDDTTLAEAVAKLSRYGGTPILIADPAVATLRISGVFSVSDPVAFSKAVAALHHMRIVHKGSAIVLKR